ncbi:phthalate transporter [Thozetella sp. PMI_491]|nr:phthalate transporter [Thozetella sp. PMI_491]
MEFGPGLGHGASEDVYSPAEERQIMRRIDTRLVFTCGLLYCISLIDRTNLSAAAIAGMNSDLNLIEYRYSIIVLVFFITYTLFQPPATILCRKIGPRPFLSAICFLWGIIMMCHGFVRSWEPMIAMRLILGALEAGCFPGCLYLISTWYSRYETHKRFSWFYLIGCVATGFSGILAFGLTQMAGLADFNGWRWIFIIEGIITCLIGVVGYFTLVDFPDKVASKTSGFLSEREVNWVLLQIARDREDAVPEPFKLSQWAANGLDLKVWGFALIFLCVTTTSYAISYFLPTILKGMGFSTTAAQCLVAPPYVAAAVVMIGASWLGDKYRTKAPILAFNAVVTIIGLCIMGYAEGTGIRYFGVFLATMSANANLPTIMAYQANNIRGQWKRAFCSASLVGFGGIGGIAGSLVFRSQDAPLYRPGIYATVTANCIVLLVVGVMSIHFRISNKKADKGHMIIEGLEGFRYTI